MMFDAFTFCLVALQICWVGLGLISLAPNSAKQRQAAPSSAKLFIALRAGFADGSGNSQ